MSVSFRGAFGFLFLIFVFFFSAIPAQAAVCDGKDDCQDKIKEYEEKLNSARVQKSSLASQISIISTKVELARVRLAKTHADIEETQAEIEELGTKIERLNAALDRLSSVLLEKIVEGYKNREVSFLDMFFSPKATTLENQLKYIRVAQENDRLLALKTQQVKVNFSEQKDLREVKKLELEELEKQLEVQKVELNTQITQKEALLQQTRSDETKYQQLLSQALAEFQAINQAIESGKKIGPVKKGDAIALIGNTGFPYCSTGKHLHFEVRKGGTWVDPGGYVGDGKDWKMPISEPITLTQGFGVTPYSWKYAYSGGIHTGWDMISGGSDVIRAVADGDLYSSTQNCSGAIIKIRYIDHGDDLMTFYLHVQ
jgi:murein DD-endopeptidase MepM/ murein hydrolase activator NlpD